MERYKHEICNCDLGPHIETELDNWGDWVRYTDMLALRGKIASMHTREELLGGQRHQYVQLSEVLDLFDA